MRCCTLDPLLTVVAWRTFRVDARAHLILEGKPRSALFRSHGLSRPVDEDSKHLSGRRNANAKRGASGNDAADAAGGCRAPGQRPNEHVTGNAAGATPQRG